MEHTRGAPYHSQTQGKIEHFHRSLKNHILVNHYLLPGALNYELDKYIDYYNNERYHECINNMIPADVYFGRAKEIEIVRNRIKRETMMKRKMQNLNYLYCN
jgi:transposase InsO family protein